MAQAAIANRPATRRRQPPSAALAAALGGVLATAADTSVLVMLSRCGLALALAAALGVGVGGAVSFVWNKHVAFGCTTPTSPYQVLAFASVVGVTAALMALGMQVVSVWLGTPYLFAKLICAVVVFATWTFPAQRKLVFA